MHSPFACAPIARLALLSVFAALPATLSAQSNASPIRRALYVALGVDPVTNMSHASVPLTGTVGVEQSRVGSRWSYRLGADYRRQTADFLGRSSWEDIGVGVSARYGRSSGTVRPYLLGGVGVAQLRTHVRDGRYYVEFDGPLSAPVSYDRVRWNGSMTTGLGTDVSLRGVKLFTEVRLNLYPGSLSNRRAQSMTTTRALLFGVKF
jgi:hypothetical protein